MERGVHKEIRVDYLFSTSLRHCDTIGTKHLFEAHFRLSRGHAAVISSQSSRQVPDEMSSTDQACPFPFELNELVPLEQYIWAVVEAQEMTEQDASGN